MKFSSVLVVASFLAHQAFVAGARPLEHDSHRRSIGVRAGAQSKFGKGGAGAGGNKGGQGAGAAAGKASAGAASTTSVAAAADAASSSAAAADTTTAAAAAATAAAASTADSGDLQTSLTLDPALIGSGLAQNGLASGEAGEVASLTSTNNFINFCASVNQPITNGTQITTGSCNPVPMGQLPATTAQPSAKFTNPTNNQVIPANTNFTVSLAVSNMDTGNFVNADTNYFGAPQQLNSAGIIVAHSHVVIESLTSITQTTPTDPTVFAFFKGLDDAAVDGILSTVVSGGLAAGTYKVSSINTAANHQPVLGPVAQHGSFDDVVYFTVQ